MFKIIAEPTFTCQVLLSRPDSDTPVPIDVTWRHKNARDLVAWLGKAQEAPDDATYLDEVVHSWSRVVGADDQPLPYSKQALASLLITFPSSGRELIQAYYRRLSDARAKN